MWNFFVSLCAVCMFLGVTFAAAETRAVLVGVSDYSDEIGEKDLRGPANDVRLMQDVLLARGAHDIVVLADGVDGGMRPTRDAILAAFADVADRTQEGDFILIQMSGHGTRQADQNGDETDGLDEVFLPADTGRAKPGSTTIPGAITDDEIGLAVAAMREKGADVWLIVDTCHAGTALRAGGERSNTRYVDPRDLGLDPSDSRRVESQVIETQGPEPKGKFVAFYASRSSETAKELPFIDEHGQERWYGLFTAKLAARLQSQSALSYRQLFQAVLSDMNHSSVPGSARLQTPSWEGNLIDAAVFGGSDTLGVQRFVLDGSRLQAGRLHGLEDATLVGLVADAADPSDAILGLAQLRKTTATRARLTPVAEDCEPVSTRPCVRTGDLPRQAKFAQVIARPIDLRLRLSKPRLIGSRNDLQDITALTELDRALMAVNEAIDTKIVLDPDNFDIEVAFDGTDFWFGASTEIGAQPVGLRVAPRADQLTRALVRIRRAETFARLLGSVAGKAPALAGPPVEVSINHYPVDIATLERPESTIGAREECEFAWEESPDVGQSLRLRAALKQCDRLRVEVQGKVRGARDVNRIHISGQFCVSVAHELVEDISAPRQIGDEMAVCSDCPWGYSAGLERMFLVVTDVQDNAEPLNLTGVAGECAPLEAQTRGGNQTLAEAQLFDFLSDAATSPGTRGMFGVSAREVWVKQYDWSVLPKTEAFAREGRAN